MGNSDSVSLMGLKGHVKVETFDARTGMRGKWTEGDNVFTNYGLQIFRNSCALLIGAQFGQNIFVPESELRGSRHWISAAFNSGDLGLFQYLYLTDNTSALTASNVATLGNITGFSYRNTSTSTNPLQGVLNISESLFANNQLTAVFDFATDRANGTHCSVFFTDRFATAPYNDLLYYSFAGKYATFPRRYTHLVEGADGYFYGAVTTTLYKIDPTTLNEIATYTLPVSAAGYIFDVYDNYCCFTPSTNPNTLYRFNMSDSTSTTFAITTSESNGGAIVDGYLYYTYGSTRFYKVDISTGVSIYNAVTLPYSRGSIRRGNGNLYLVYGTGTLSGSDSVQTTLHSYTYNTNILGAAVYARAGYSYICNTSSLPTNIFWLQNNAASYYNGTANVARFWLSKYDISQPLANAITAKLLDEPVTKLDTQTMKVTYTINIV